MIKITSETRASPRILPQRSCSGPTALSTTSITLLDFSSIVEVSKKLPAVKVAIQSSIMNPNGTSIRSLESLDSAPASLPRRRTSTLGRSSMVWTRAKSSPADAKRTRTVVDRIKSLISSPWRGEVSLGRKRSIIGALSSLDRAAATSCSGITATAIQRPSRASSLRRSITSSASGVNSEAVTTPKVASSAAAAMLPLSMPPRSSMPSFRMTSSASPERSRSRRSATSASKAVAKRPVESTTATSPSSGLNCEAKSKGRTSSIPIIPIGRITAPKRKAFVKAV